MSGEITLSRTYFLARDEDLPRYYQRYLERVERVKQFTTVYLVADVEVGESDSVLKKNLLHALQAQSDEPVNEDEWNMFGCSTALGTINEPTGPGAAVPRLWEDMLLTGDEEWSRSLISSVNFSSFMSRPQ